MDGDAKLPERGHLLIRGATILTMDPDLGELASGDIEVRDGKIVAVGADLAAPSATVLDASRMIALPGFVDAHWHVWFTLMRGVMGDGPRYGAFARKLQLGPHYTPDDTYQGVRLGLVEGLAAGVTTVHNWAHYVKGSEDADANLRAQRDVGVRGMFSYGAPSAAPGLSLEDMAESLRGAVKAPDEVMDFANIARIQAELGDGTSDLLTIGVNLRGPSRSEPDVYRAEWDLARELGLEIAMHCAGTREEVARIRQIEVLDRDGLLDGDMLLAHCLYISPHERALLAAHGIPIAVSPLSSLRLAMGVPPILDHIDAGISVSLSFDTTAVAGSADVFQAMRLAVGFESIGRSDPEALTPWHALELATIDGARALGLEAVTGSITPGKRADLILVRSDHVNLAPVSDAASAIVHSAQPANVDTVVIDGRVLKADGKLTAVDVDDVVGEAEAAAHNLWKRAGIE